MSKKERNRTDTARLEQYSVGHGTTSEIRPGETIVLVPEPVHGEKAEPAGRRLSRAFEIARSLLGEGSRVRIVASGASLTLNWPNWIEDVTGLVTSELGAYRMVHPIIASRDLAQSVHSWIDWLAASLNDRISASEALYASAGNRFLQPLFEAVSYVDGLSDAHPDGTFICLDRDWSGLELLRQRTEVSGGKVLPERVDNSGWRARVALLIVWRLIGAVAGQILRFVRSRSSIRKLRTFHGKGNPKVWLALDPNWPRGNSHLLQRLAADKTGYGILLTTSLVPSREHRGGELWPGIPEWATLPDSGIPIGQLVLPELLTSFLACLVRGIWLVLKVAVRLICFSDHEIIRTVGNFSKFQLADRVARFVTADVIQALMIDTATRRCVRRHDLANTIVVFSVLNVVDTAAANSSLQRSGVITIDFRHGSGGLGWFGFHETFTDYVLGRSQVDVELIKMLSQKPLLVAPPSFRTSPIHRPVQNILLLSGYSHESWGPSGFPLEHFEIELLRSAELLASVRPDLTIRWRPHPSDDTGQIAAHAAKLESVSLSGVEQLVEELDWADLVVTYGGTTLTESVQTGLPVLVHAMPSLLTYPDIERVGEGRRFFYAPDLLDCITKIDVMDAPARAKRARCLFNLFFTPDSKVQILKDLDFSRLSLSSRPNRMNGLERNRKGQFEEAAVSL
ncbi:hypothetical protein [Novosphingopyxis sp. YJ-S2-01]|uniref:hypothetical protein n=1 Tax=Novosphingopyxis sp. YJ-S2-01 TaxID=2794021 RepID=UPI0018DD747C|nr:hypothetical protein [Novosphingopyxis sp. YJ-S2-01]MBH9538456.1 hypothetical protein [Novosphingopyxis sp. YJ-S2-01]